MLHRSQVRIGLVAVVLGVSACGLGPDADPTPEPTPVPVPEEVIAVAPTAEALARAWLARVPTGGGTLLVVDETLALGMLAGGSVAGAIVHRRATPEEERDAASEGLVAAGALEHVLLARDSIAIAVHPANPLGALTRAQARGLLSGESTWDDIPGPATSGGAPVLRLPAGPAHVFLRGQGHSSLRGLALLRVGDPGANAVRLGTDEAVLDRLAEDPAGIALVPASILLGADSKPRGKAIGLGESGGGAVVLPGSGVRGGPIWPLLRPLYLVRAADPGTAGEALVAVARSLPGEKITAEHGFLRASPVRAPRAHDRPGTDE